MRPVGPNGTVREKAKGTDWSEFPLELVYEMKDNANGVETNQSKRVPSWLASGLEASSSCYRQSLIGGHAFTTLRLASASVSFLEVSTDRRRSEIETSICLLLLGAKSAPVSNAFPRGRLCNEYTVTFLPRAHSRRPLD